MWQNNLSINVPTCITSFLVWGKDAESRGITIFNAKGWGMGTETIIKINCRQYWQGHNLYKRLCNFAMRKDERPIAKKVHTKLKLKAELIPNLPPHSVTISRYFTLQFRGQSFLHCIELQDTNFQSYKFNVLQANRAIHSILHLPLYCSWILGSNFRQANLLSMTMKITNKMHYID